MRYPETRRSDFTEVLHGRTVADPYRWLEDADAPEVQAWVETQRAFGEGYLDTLPSRDWFRGTLRRLLARPRCTTPFKEGPLWFITRNDGTQNQDVWYVADSLEELADGGRVFVDPNEWSADGTSSLAMVRVSDDGRHATLSRSDAGSDWHTVIVVSLPGMEPVGEPLVTKFSVPVWLPDNESFLIHRYPDVGTAEGSDTQALTPADLVIHRLDGTEEVLWENPGDPMLFTHAQPSFDRRWLIMQQSWGTERTASVTVFPLTLADGSSAVGEPIDVVPTRQHAVYVLRTDRDDLIALSDEDAPTMRVVRYPIAPSARPQTLVPASPNPIEDVLLGGDHLAVIRMVDVTPRLFRYGLDGAELGEIELPAGAFVASDSHVEERCATVGLSTPASPRVNVVVDLETGTAAVRDFALRPDPFTMPELTIERHHATSADGTKVPYWQIARAGTDLGAIQPTIVYGYGGFAAIIQPTYNPGFAAWLSAGGVMAICNLRGGSEFGTAWYDDGRKANKQHVFDDVVAVGEDLTARGCSDAHHMAVYGRSNGGLLAGAALTQRPDLWACALPQVGVLDVLRFHKFTGGAAWASDYGNPDIAADFLVAERYSPLQNVREGTVYPPTLITTGDHDDRVVPLHSHKFTAALQHAQAGEGPIIERIEKATGHGSGKPAAMIADEWADIMAFAATHTGLEPR